jgi:hypothetical protein
VILIVCKAQGIIMKKLCMLLTYAACLSSNFAAASPVNGFDDCDRKFPLRGDTNGIVAPQNTPQAGPQAEPSSGLQFGEAGFLTQLFLPTSADALVKENQDPSGTPQILTEASEVVLSQDTKSESNLSGTPVKENQDPSGTPQILTEASELVFSQDTKSESNLSGTPVERNMDSSGASQENDDAPDLLVTPMNQANNPEFEPSHFPDLKIYYSERDGEEASLKRFTTDVLKSDYARLKPGDVLEVIFVPDVRVNEGAGASNECVVKKISAFDTVAWSANIRAWVKWWLNPWAWWNPSRYSFDNTNDKVVWDSVTSKATIQVKTVKDELVPSS